MKSFVNIISNIIKLLIVIWSVGHIVRGTASAYHIIAIIMVFGHWAFQLIHPDKPT